jgi:hypothetical protein
MFTIVPPDGDGKCRDPSQVTRLANWFGLTALEGQAIDCARDLAASLLGEGVAPATTFKQVQARAGAAVFGFFEGGELTATLAAFPMLQEGLRRLQSGAFDAVNLDPDLAAPPGAAPAAYYGWGFAAKSKAGGRAVVKASVAIHRWLYYATPTFARAVTADGRRALTSIGFRPAPSGQDDLLWIAPRAPGLTR